MTPERLAEIRRRTREHVEILARVSGLEGSDVPFDWRARAELVAEVDRLREEIMPLADELPGGLSSNGARLWLQDRINVLLGLTEEEEDSR